MGCCFQINPSDNVATLLDDSEAGPVNLVGHSGSVVVLLERICLGHKVSLETIQAGQPVVKFGVPIGIATRAIKAGEWVHLHNCRSQVDERSGTLDAQTGAVTDTRYE